jgi:amino acid adenylation domain-containing protein
VAYLFHQLLSEAAAADPDREALRFRGGSMTWGQIDAMANGVAQALVDGGVRRGDRVGFYIPKRLETIPAIFGAFKAGGVFVALDTNAPMERTAMIAGDCTIKALVSTPARAAELVAAMGPLAPDVVLIIDDGTGPVDLPGTVIPYERATADRAAREPGVFMVDLDLATITYTSGSTGVPKGVMRTHLGLIHMGELLHQLIDGTADDRYLNFNPFHWIGGVIELGLWLMSRGTLAVLPAEEMFMGASILRALQEERITAWFALPPAFMLLLEAGAEPGSLPELTRVLYGGATFPTKYVRTLRRLVPNAKIWHGVGSTESGIVAVHQVEEIPEDDSPIPAGRCIGNNDMLLVKEDGTPAGPGEEGEAYTRSKGIFSGYWNDPEKTAERLVPNPLAPHLFERVCRTGDILRVREDGIMEFVGRRDHQIKTRGYRVDLGEVEVALNAHPAVYEAIVLAVPHPEWEKALVACVAPHEGVKMDASEVKAHIADRLPLYMVPAKVVFFDELPHGSTGKVDRKKLQEAMERETVAEGTR